MLHNVHNTLHNTVCIIVVAVLFSSQVREHAVHHLLHYPAGDLPHCEHWAELRNALRMCLCDDISPLVVNNECNFDISSCPVPHSQNLTFVSIFVIDK